MMKKYFVICDETGITHFIFDNQSEAEKKAKEMTEYHNQKYIVNGGVYVHGVGSVRKIEIRGDGFPEWCPLEKIVDREGR